jgi:hypothetical protein
MGDIGVVDGSAVPSIDPTGRPGPEAIRILVTGFGVFISIILSSSERVRPMLIAPAVQK